jgi:hypothetical protein
LIKEEKMFLKKGEVVYLSVPGRNGFYYPSTESETLLEDVQAETLAWVGGNLKTAVLIPKSSIFGTGSNKIQAPVWVNKTSIMGR